MKWPLLFVLLFTFSLKPLIAHVPDAGPLVIPLGETREFHITADVQDEPAPTAYKFLTNTNPAIASVTSAPNFSKAGFGSWTIKANATQTGTTTMSFRWDYLPGTPKAAGANVSIVVNVVAPGSSAATNEYHLNVADPVNSRTGEYYGVEAVDLSLGGPLPLGFSRYYASALVADGVAAGALGANRLHNFDAKLTVETFERRVVVRTNRGRKVTFEKPRDGTKWTQVGRKDRVFGLMEEEGIYYFFSPAEQGVWVFDNAGKLTSITDGRGNTHTLTYAGAQLASVADGLGRTLTFTHTSGRITRVADHTGRHVDFTYSGANLATAADTTAKVTTYSYDGAGLLTSYTMPAGNVPFTQVFTAGKVTSQTERGTDTTTMSYGANSTTITQPSGATMTHTYAATGELASYTDEGGKTVTTTSDATGRRSGVADRTGDATGITYHAPSGLPEKVTNAQGGTSTMTYKARVLKLPGVTDAAKALTFFDLAKVTFPDGTFESFTYDANGNMLTRTDRAGKKRASTFNGRGQPLTMTNPTGGVTTLTYDAAGNLASPKDSETGVTTYTYDTLNRLITIARPGGATVHFEYDARDLLSQVTDERGKETDFSYDDNGRLDDITDADTNATQFAYDALNRVLQVTDRLGKVSSRAFDARRLLASVTDRNGNATTFAYDTRQRPTSTTDAGGKTWTLGFDDESQPASGANPIDPPGKIKRNAMGRVVEASNALGHTSAVVRDAMQRVMQAIDPLGRVTKFSYDKRGQLISVAEEGGGAAKFTRDALGQVTAITAPNGGIWKSSYTKEGRLHESADPLGKIWHRTYDPRGRLATVEHPGGITQTLTYDNASNVTRSQFTGGPDFNFTFDNLNRLATADDATTADDALTFTYDAEGRLTNSQQAAEQFGATYDDGGRLKTVTYNGGALVVTYTYDTRNRLTGVSDNVSGATVAFTHDDAGRVTGITRGNGVNTTHTYDTAGRLTRIQHGAAIDVKYARNAVGEVTAEDIIAPTLPAAPVANDAFTFDKAGQLTSAGFTYDERGRLTASPGATFAWDAANRLTQAGGFAASYNALGEIITRNGPGGVTRYFHHHAIAGSPIVSEKADGSAAFTRHYVHTPGGALLYAMLVSGPNAEQYYHLDHLGSTLALSNEAGTITDSYARGPFGENEQHTGSSTQPFTWLGALGVRKDGALFQMRARYYDPKTARFLSRDPLGPRLADVKSLNPYAYANDNPMRYVDPEGRQEGPAPDWANKNGGGVLKFSEPMATDLVEENFETFIAPESSLNNIVEQIANGSLGSDQTAYESKPARAEQFTTALDDAQPPLAYPGTAITQLAPAFISSINDDLVPAANPPRNPLDIIRENAAKFGGVVHSSARSLLCDTQIGLNLAFRRQLNETWTIPLIQDSANPDHPPSFGRTRDDSAADMNPGTMHVIITNFLGVSGIGVVEDHTFSDSMWGR